MLEKGHGVAQVVFGLEHMRKYGCICVPLFRTVSLCAKICVLTDSLTHFVGLFTR